MAESTMRRRRWTLERGGMGSRRQTDPRETLAKTGHRSATGCQHWTPELSTLEARTLSPAMRVRRTPA